MKILSVLIEYRLSSLSTPFSYVCNDEEKVEVGCRVYIPFANQNIVGYVIDIKHTNLTLQQLCEKDNVSYKYIYKVLDEKPILDDELFNLAKHMEKEYVCPLISCLQTILPPTYKPSSSALKELTYKKLKKVFVKDNIDESKLKPSQLELINKIRNENGIYLKDLPLARINTLKKHDLVYTIEEVVQEDYFKDYVIENQNIKLNEEQQNAYESIINSDKNVILLQGVTGSGKTEVYLNLASYYVSLGQSVVILVTEISLTPMIIQRFKNRFKDNAV